MVLGLNLPLLSSTATLEQENVLYMDESVIDDNEDSGIEFTGRVNIQGPLN
jgi:hypothetical protein